MPPYVDAADALAVEPEAVDAAGRLAVDDPQPRGRGRRELPVAETQEVGDVRDEAAGGPARPGIRRPRRLRARARRARARRTTSPRGPPGRITRSASASSYGEPRAARPRESRPASSRCSHTTTPRSAPTSRRTDGSSAAERGERTVALAEACEVAAFAVVAARMAEQVAHAHVGRPDAGGSSGVEQPESEARGERLRDRGDEEARLGLAADRRRLRRARRPSSRQRARARPRRPPRPRKRRETSNPSGIRYPTARPGLGRARLPSRRAETSGDTARERGEHAPHQGREAGARSEVRQARDGHRFAGGPDRDADASGSTS